MHVFVGKKKVHLFIYFSFSGACRALEPRSVDRGFNVRLLQTRTPTFLLMLSESWRKCE